MRSGGIFDVESKEKKLKELEGLMAGPEFWADQKKAQAVVTEASLLRRCASSWKELKKRGDEIAELIELAEEETDETLLPEIEKSIQKFNNDLDKLELEALFTDQYDTSNAIVGFHAGAGGTESCDWANMLLRMYLRWAEKKGFQTKIIDYLPGEEAGIKNVTVIISGAYAYGYLKAESGVHRLVRISPFDSNKRRHTSFASVDVIPELEEDIEVDIKDEDLRIDIYRASGPGGQGVNTTDSAVRIMHLPTKIMVQCQNERSQHKNKAMAMKVLKARLYRHYLEKRKEEIEEKWGDKKDIAWGSQIRSYVFQPYTMIKDHRTGVEIGNVQKIMDGGIDPFIEAYLRKVKSKK